MVSGSSPGNRNGSFITSGAAISARDAFHNVPLPPWWNFCSRRKPPMTSPGASCRAILVALLEARGEHGWQSGIADFPRRCRDVVRHADVGQHVLRLVEQGVTGRRIVVAGLPDGAEHGKEAPIAQ